MPISSSSGASGLPGEAMGITGTDRQVLTVAAVARRLGIAPATLRTWDRRYGLGPNEHQSGAHRRYTRGDLARLSLMRRLTLEGMPPGEAAQLAISAGPDEAEAALGAALAEPDVPPTDRPEPGRAGGGRVVALPHADPAARGLARAAMSLDAAACVEILTADIDARGVIGTWETMLRPVLAAIGERWAVTGQGIDVEHLLSEAVLTVLRGIRPLVATAAGSSRFALLAGAEAEQHVLPLHVLAAALAERRVPARVLGGAMPREALAAAVRRSGPAAVFVWSQLVGTGDPSQLAGLPALRPAPRTIVGGPGWDPARIPAGVYLATSLPDAVEQVLVAAAR
ncbi:MAG: MerR family transcriptional regulator [Actinomycetota bacterium]|nr:MerR family transcriptional regulator [Actinomycetota bacterium]